MAHSLNGDANFAEDADVSTLYHALIEEIGAVEVSAETLSLAIKLQALIDRKTGQHEIPAIPET